MLRTESVPDGAELRTGPRHSKRNRLVWWPLAGVLVVYIAMASVFAWRTPAWENNDESDHVQYIEHVASTGLPPAISLKNGIESHQAPFYYYVAAGWQYVLQIPTFVPHPRPATASPHWRGSQLYYLSHQYTARGRQQAMWVHELRMLSLVFGIGTVAAAYLTGWLLLRRTSQAAAVAATVALWPKFVVVTTAVTNSSLAFALCAAALLCSVKWWQSRRAMWAVLFGTASGLAVLTDITTLPVAAVSILIVIGLAVRERDWHSPVAGTGAFLAITAWWLAYNAVRYGDPLRSRVTTDYLKPFAGGALVRVPPHLSAQILDTFGRVLVHSVWWDGGWNQLHLPGSLDWALTAVGVVCVLAALVYRVGGWFLLAGCALGSAVAWLELVRVTTQGEGRYVLISIAAWAFLLVAGAGKLARGHPAAWWIWPVAFVGIDLWLVFALLIPYGRI